MIGTTWIASTARTGSTTSFATSATSAITCASAKRCTHLACAPRPSTGPPTTAEDPAFRQGLAGAIRFPGDGHLRPDRYTAGLAAALVGRGGAIEEHVGVDGFEEDGQGVRLATSAGPRRAREVIVATGPWSPRLAAAAGLRLPVQPGQGLFDHL